MCKRCPCGLLVFVVFEHIKNHSLMLSSYITQRTFYLMFIHVYTQFLDTYFLYHLADEISSNSDASLKYYHDLVIIPMVELAECDTFYGRKTLAKTRYISHGFVVKYHRFTCRETLIPDKWSHPSFLIYRDSHYHFLPSFTAKSFIIN